MDAQDDSSEAYGAERGKCYSAAADPKVVNEHIVDPAKQYSNEGKSKLEHRMFLR